MCGRPPRPERLRAMRHQRPPPTVATPRRTRATPRSDTAMNTGRRRPREGPRRALRSRRNAVSTPRACGSPKAVARDLTGDAPARAWREQPLGRQHVTPKLPFRGGAGAPLARQRGGRPRSRDTPAQGSGASSRRRSCGHGGVDARGPRRERGRPAGQRRCSGGWRRTRPQTELAESEERDPPTGPARHRLTGLRVPPRQWRRGPWRTASAPCPSDQASPAPPARGARTGTTAPVSRPTPVGPG